MPGKIDLIAEIRLKVTRLKEEKQQLLQRVEQLTLSNDALKSEVQQQKNTIETLQTQNKIVKLAEILPSDTGENEEVKKLLREYIREIDECIRLLSA